jgi:hypothetical protein
MTGCGSAITLSVNQLSASTGISCGLPAALPTAALPIQGNTLHSLGDSITAGFLLSNPATQVYPQLMGVDLGLKVTNEAINGRQACDLALNEIFPNNENPSVADNQLYTVMIGTNDVAQNVPGYIPVFAQCHQAALAWLGVPAESKTRANAAGVHTTGSGGFSTGDNWSSWNMSTAGSAISLPITLSVSGPIYLWTRIIDGDGGTFSWSVDGVTVGTGSTSTTPVIRTSASTTMSMTMSRMASVAAGHHVVTVTQTSSTGTVQVLAVGSPAPASSPAPQILSSDIPYLLGTGSTGCTGTSTVSLQYIQQIQADVELLAGDGVRITYVPTRRYFFGTSAEMIDQTHPNPFGDGELRNAFEASLTP